MNTQRNFKIVATGVVLALSLWLLGPRIATALSDSFTQSAPSGAFQYAVHHKVGSVEIDVTFNDISGQADVQRYMEANAARAEALLQSATGERLWTTIPSFNP